MHLMEFEHPVPASEQQQPHAIDYKATGIGSKYVYAI
jgi:hypothetical protein